MTEKSRRSRWRWKALLASFVCGGVAVMGAGIVVKATDNGEFCGVCHSMTPSVWTHQQSIHSEQTCNDCHTPHNIVRKLPYKAKVGIHDILVTVTNSVPDTIHASDEMKMVIKENCIRCHYSTVQKVDMDVKNYCTDCHKAVPHSGKMPMSEREAADV